MASDGEGGGGGKESSGGHGDDGGGDDGDDGGGDDVARRGRKRSNDNDLAIGRFDVGGMFGNGFKYNENLSSSSSSSDDDDGDDSVYSFHFPSDDLALGNFGLKPGMILEKDVPLVFCPPCDCAFCIKMNQPKSKFVDYYQKISTSIQDMGMVEKMGKECPLLIDIVVDFDDGKYRKLEGVLAAPPKFEAVEYEEEEYEEDEAPE